MLLTFKALHNLSPPYIVSLIEQYKPARALRSESQNLLTEKKAKTKKYGDRCFSVAAPKL